MSASKLRAWLAHLHVPSEVAFALAISATWLLAYNARFWHETIDAMWQPGATGLLFFASLALLVLFLQALLLLLIPTQLGLRIAVSLLFVIASLGAHFTSTYGTVIDKDMIRNVFQTDVAETRDLLNVSLFVRTALLGIFPAILVWFVDIPQRPWWRRLRQRTLFAVTGILACLLVALASSASYATFLREYKPLRAMVSPLAPVWSTIAYLASRADHPNRVARIDPGGEPRRVLPPAAGESRRPLVVVLVVGETARAANFQLGGYSRATNPELSAREDIAYFEQATSCGTSTAASLPCMFSHLGRAAFSAGDAERYANVLDVAQRAGIAVQWRDNNSGCKGVCDRVPTLNYFAEQSLRTNRPSCNGSRCYDEVLLDTLASRLAARGGDSLIVLHQNGSHGPAYVDRYPQAREFFKPACRTPQLAECSHAEVVAAYDNSIRYTDYLLARLIDTLEAAPVDSAMIYVSDHGESLGENGIYLHGMPYAFAPDNQKHVPMLLWFSNGYRQSRSLDDRCLASLRSQPVSHDNLYHTLLGTLGVRNGVYLAPLDLISRCAGKGA